MPRVPVSSGPNVRDQALQGGYRQEVDVSSGERMGAKAADSVAGAVEARQYRNDQDTAFATDAKIKTEWLEYEGKLRDARRGRDAASYDAEVQQWWQDAAGRHADGLSPGAQRLVSRSLTTSQVQAVAGAKAYKEQQLNASADASYRAAQAVSINEAATVGNEAATIKAQADMDQKRADRAALMGWTPEQVKADATSWNTTLHSTVVQKLMRADPTAAQQYYDKYKGQIGAEQQAALENHLQQTSVAVDGNTAATAIWSQFGPKADGQPVELDKMEEAVRAQYPKDPARQKAAIGEVQQRAAAFNAAERERTAGKTNAVMSAYSKGATLAQLQTMPEFQSMPGAQQAQIQDHIRDRNHTLWAQSVEDRARLQREQEQKAYPAFLEYSNPQNLGAMTRSQVQALQPMMGNALTEHLVTKWDALQKPQAKLEARMDTEDFNHVADQLGLSPFKANTEDKKRELGELKYRVEQVINGAQVAKKGSLTRDEKMDLMKAEMSRTVTVDPTFGFKREVPVIQLNSKQVADVVIPDTERPKVAAALKAMYDETKDPAWAPTEENLRRAYLLGKSSASKLITPPK